MLVICYGCFGEEGLSVLVISYGCLGEEVVVGVSDLLRLLLGEEGLLVLVIFNGCLGEEGGCWCW